VAFPVVATVGPAARAAEAEPAGAIPCAVDPRTEQINSLLNLERSTVVTLDMERLRGNARTVVVPINGEPVVLNLLPYSVRSPRFEVKAQVADGSYVSVPPPPVTTMKGTVAGVDGLSWLPHCCPKVFTRGYLFRTATIIGSGPWPLDLRTAHLMNMFCIEATTHDQAAGHARRCPLQPAVPDRVINILDLLFVVAAFKGQPFPFSPGPWPCP